MSIVCAVYLAEGIVMAADSRITGTQSIIDTENNMVSNNFYTLSDNGQKVFLLNTVSVGVLACGEMEINGRPIFDFLRMFEIEKVEKTDTTEIVANKLLEFLNGNFGTVFIVAGYHNDLPYVYDLSSGAVKRFNTIEDEAIYYGSLWNGQQAAMNKLFSKECEDPLMVNYVQMPLKDGIDFAEFIVDTTIKYERFHNSIQTCGGPIDILVLTKDDAFWHKHKIYRP